VIKVKQGVPVRFNITVEGADPGCGRYVGVKGLGVHAIASPGESVPMDFTPAQTGIFQINCDMQMMDPGYVIVTE
jgi:plastocyanin domain-containing protein